MSEALPHSERLAHARLPILLGGGACLFVLLVFGFFEPGRASHWSLGQFCRSWLFAWLFWLGLTLGSMGVVMMHHLLHGGWGYLVRRFGEAASGCVPVMALLFVPVVLGARYIYPWADADTVAADPVLQHKLPYLNLPFFIVRAVIYFVAFWALSWMLRSTSRAHDRTESPSLIGRLKSISAGGEVLYFVLMTLASIDWIMSREPHWKSSIFGFITVTSQALSAVCFLIIMLYLYSDEPPLKSAIHSNYINDLGSVLIVFVIFWAYLSLSQFLVIWLGNEQNEITWYIRRTAGGWRWVGAALIVFHFMIPFVLLLLRPIKKNLGRLAAVAGGVFFMRVIDVLYWVTPADPHNTPWGAGHWLYAEFMNLLALLGIGGIWFATFLWFLKSAPVLPTGDRIPVVPEKHGRQRTTTSAAVE